MKKILAVDYDNCITHLVEFPHRSRIRAGNRLVWRYVRRKKRQGWLIILNTARHGVTLVQARAFCESHDIPIDLYNENSPELIEQYEGDTRKIVCDRSLDDNQCGLLGWLLRKFC